MMRFIATFGFVGLIPIAPGTFGSLAALPAAYGLHYLGGFPALALATIAVFIIGTAATAAVTRGAAEHDPGSIVIDEVAGQFIALWPLSAGLWFASAAPHVFPWPGWIGAFLLFRLFDIWKPWPVSWADNMHTPFGVMLDDVIAGIMGALLLTVAAGISHGWMGL